MNLLPSFFLLLLILSSISYGILRSNMHTAYRYIAYESYSQMHTTLLNARQKEIFNKVRAKPKKRPPNEKKEQARKNSRSFPYKNRRDLPPFLDRSKLNLYALFIDDSPQRHPLFPIACSLLEELYATSLFASSSAPSGSRDPAISPRDFLLFLSRRVKEVVKQRQTEQADPSSSYAPISLLLLYEDLQEPHPQSTHPPKQKAFNKTGRVWDSDENKEEMLYIALQGTSTYDIEKKEGLPPLGDFILIDPRERRKALVFHYARKEIMEAFFSPSLYSQILQLEKEKHQKYQGKKKDVKLAKKTEILPLLLRAKKEDLLPFIQYNAPPKERESTSFIDHKTGLRGTLPSN